jgi:O-antigen/teichoic acid export membrane protein
VTQAVDDELRDDARQPAPPAFAPSRAATTPREKLKVAINASSNASVQVIKAVVSLIVTPILVDRLGDSRNGIWLFISAIAGYLTLGDFGVKNTIIRFVARYDGLRDDDGINRVYNTSSAILLRVAAVILTITILAGWLWRLPSSIPAEYTREARWFLVISGIQMAILLPISVPQATLAGLGQFPLRNAISIVSLLLRNIAFVTVVLLGGGLVEIGLVLLANCALDYVMAVWALRRCFPALSHARRFVDRDMFRTICGYGAHVFSSDIASLIIAQSAPLIIGMYLWSTASNTYFGLGSYPKESALSILAMVILVLIPAVSKWHAAGDDGAIRVLIVHAMRFTLYFTLPIEIGLIVFGHPFLALWMKDKKYADAGFGTLVILSLPLVLTALGMIASRVMLGIGKVRSIALITWLQAVLTVEISIALSQSHGIEGVAWGASVALLICAPATAILMFDSLHLNPLATLAKASWRPLVASAAAAGVWLAAKPLMANAIQAATHGGKVHLLPLIKGWTAFIGVGLLGAVPFVIVILCLEHDFRRLAVSLWQTTGALLGFGTRSRNNHAIAEKD